MPYRLPHPCAHPGRPWLTQKRYCATHAGETAKETGQEGPAPYDQHRGSSSTRGYGRNWQKIRKAHLQKEPLCRDCLSIGLTVPATDVDHINGDATDCRDENLASRCHSCHSRKTVRENGGFGKVPSDISHDINTR
jgi:5-methylcytosine-specific restriction enzyme A